VENMPSFPQQVEWEVTISLQPFSFIDDLASISIENCPLSISLSEAFQESLSDTVNKLRVNLSSDLEVVVAEHKVSAVS